MPNTNSPNHPFNNQPNNREPDPRNKLYDDLITRISRIETRLCRAMIGLGLDPVTGEPVDNSSKNDSES